MRSASGPRQVPADDAGQRFLAVAAGVPGGERRVGGEDALQRLRRTRHGGEGGRTCAAADARRRGEGGRNPIEHHSGLERHGAGAEPDAGLAALDARRPRPARRSSSPSRCSSTSSRCATRRRSQHPWLQAIVLADQRQEAQKTQELVQGHLNAMALRLGELQARMMRLDGLGERLAKIAGLKPQELPSLQPGRRPAAAAPSRRCRRATLSRRRILRAAGEARAARSTSAPTSWACSRRCSSPTRRTASSCRRWRRSSTAGSRRTSATGSTRSPGSSRSTRASTFRPTRHADRRRGERQGRSIADVPPPVW